LLLIGVSLFMHKGLWGLGQRLWSARRGVSPASAKEDRA
jgi:branched-chain amino acid transport system permease protein